MESITNEPMQKTIEELRTFEKKNLLINRIKLGITAFLAVLCIVIAVVLIKNVSRISKNIDDLSAVVTEAGENINEVATDLQKIDFVALGDSAKTFADVGTETTQQIKDATSGLDTILSDAEQALQSISSINIDQLNADIKALHDVLEPLSNFFKVFH